MFDSSSFVHLEVRSCFSIKEGAFTPEALVAHAVAAGMSAVALTDRDGLYGAARFVAACEREGIQPILGASVTVRGRSGHPAGCSDGPSGRLDDAIGGPSLSFGDPYVVLLATDVAGYSNLCRLITDAHLLGERGDPWVDPRQILAHAAGLIALLGPRSPVGMLVARGQIDGAATELLRWREAFGDRLYVSVAHRMEQGSATEIRDMLRAADRAGVRAVATNPVRYLEPADAFLADALECMRRIVPVADTNVSRSNAEGYLKTPAAMRALFAERPDLCDRAVEIAGRCAFDLGLRKLHFPDFPVPGGRSADAALTQRCWRGVHERGMADTPELHARLHLELSMIRQLGFAAYFLTVTDIVADIKAMGIMAACRGSAAGSLVCYLTGISDVDALRHDLSFERFLNPMRDEPPDIDVDVESARREDVYDMVLGRHGDERAACVAMVDTYRARSAVREVGKALGLPEVEVGVVAKSFPHISARGLRRAVETLPELQGINLPMQALDLLFHVAERLDGFPRHIALHPCGIILAGHDLVERVPLERSAGGHRMVQADKDDVEALGYLKLDVLGVRMLSSMRHALDEIARTTGEKVDLGAVPLDDEPTFETIRASDTLGCFQIESPGQRELLQKLQPRWFGDLIIDISLFRPGPVKSDMIRPFLARRDGRERPVYAHPALKPALQETYGVIVYHEQVMRTIAAMTGYDLTYADHIRRHLDREDLLPGFERDVLARAEDRGIDRGVAKQTWDAVAQFASFGFCKAHAAAFAVPTYRSSWLKTHYPAHFISGLLTHDPGMYPRRLILEDARQHGIPILPLDVNMSEPDYVVEVLGTDEGGRVAPERRRGGPKGRPSSAGAGPTDLSVPNSSPMYGIRLALQEVRGISDAEIRSILQGRAERPFTSVGDFLRRTVVAKPVAEALAHAGAFDSMPDAKNRRAHLFEAITTATEREGEQLTLGTDTRTVPPAYIFKDYTDAEVVKAELEVLGLDASRHIVSFFEGTLADLGVTRTKDLAKQRGGTKVMVAGVKVASQTPAIRSGQRIIFLTLDDATGPVEVTVFESVQPKVARTVFHSYALAVWGELRRTGVNGVSIIAEEVWDLTALHRARERGELREAMGRRAEPSAPARRLWHSSGGSAG